MPGFNYQTFQGDGTDVFRSFLALGGAHEVFCGRFVIEPGDTAAVVTGVGFQPEVVLIMNAVVPEATFLTGAVLSLGIATATDTWAGVVTAFDLSSSKEGEWRDDLLIVAGGCHATLDSFDADGFTLDISPAAAGSDDLDVQFLAIRGGNYAVGTELIPAGTGLQAISGLGFEPTAVFFASAEVDTLNTPETLFAWMDIGAADGTNQFNAWAGSDAGDIYTNQAVQSAALSLWRDANVGGPFQPALLAEANLDSLDADGFTLDWTTVDATQRYYSWFAVDDSSYVGRWTYNHVLVDTGSVSTPFKPRGLIFFMNNMAIDGSRPEAESLGALLSLGLWGGNGGQFVIGYDEADNSSFSVPRSTRSLEEGFCIGSFAAVYDGILTVMPNNQQNLAAVTTVEGGQFLPQIYRRVFPS